jgi:undecaprenyl-phosphate galactose phosphotransferase
MTSDVRALPTEIEAAPLTLVALSARETFYRKRGKRAFDAAVAIVLLALTAPLLLGLAALVGLTSGWPTLYFAERIGRDGRPFKMWKFRTMVPDAEFELARWRQTNPALAAAYEEQFKLDDDPRVTRFGRFLRRSSLDELPQLWNVLRGDMSLVGVRPVVAAEVERYGEQAAFVLASRPGITGAWQVGGRNQVGYPQRKWIDVEYCQSTSLLGDLRILLRTLAAPFSCGGL